ncbi:MAG: hypothetical protein U0105_04765 [Candidatus Obscuribacterales bacterium]
MKAQKHVRAPRGNTLAMVAGVTIVLLMVVGLIVLYLSMVRSGSEHRSAIDSAALAAAKDISRIAINTPEFGWVALTTEPPIGRDTNAPDQWFQEVHSVNELMATVRLEMIIANELGDNFMRDLAISDYNDVMQVKDDLTTEINQALPSGGSAKDAAGNTLTPYQSAQRVYLMNQAKQSTYVPGSMTLTLGCVQGGLETGTPAPNPIAKAAAGPSQTSNQRYMSETNIPFGGKDFIFGSVGRHVGLVEKDKFVTAIGGLSYQMPAVVKVSARQQFQDQGKTWQVNYDGCACAGSTEPPRPAPGALTLSFPDGPVPEISRAGDVWNCAGVQGTTAKVYQSDNGDFIIDRPAATLAAWGGKPIPFTSPANPSASETARLALYDWLRCGGSKVDIDSVVQLQTRALNAPSTPQIMWKSVDPANAMSLINFGMVPTGVMHIYTFDANGVIQYRSVDIKPYPYTVIGEKQLYAETVESNPIGSAVPLWTLTGIKYKDILGNILTDGQIQGTGNYDMFVRDFSRQLGNIKGGQHGGERMDGNPLVSYAGAYPIEPLRGGRTSLTNDIAMAPVPDAEFCTWSGESSSGPSTSSSTSSSSVSTSMTSTSGSSSTTNSGTTNTGGAGQGAPIPVSRQDDFASTSTPPPPYITYTRGPGGGAPRPCYRTNGVSADIRFRRQVKVGLLQFMIGGYEFGYVADMR